MRRKDLLALLLILAAILIVFLIVLSIFAFKTCRVPTLWEKNESYAEVCLRVYSGRPDPCWNLTSSETKDFVSMVKNSNWGNWATLEGPGLGYNGFWVSFSESKDFVNTTPFFPLSVFVYNGTIGYNKDMNYWIDSRAYTNEPNPHFVYKKDEGKRVENWLLETGKGYLDLRLYSFLKQGSN